tara:strand:+ start:472 stop:3012 length:2541 start_codon:yes stop_codon:yes gene_type:complete
MQNSSIDMQFNKASKFIKNGSLKEAQLIYNNILFLFPHNKRAKEALTLLSNKTETSSVPYQKLKELRSLYNKKKYFAVLELGKELLKNFYPNSTIYYILGMTTMSVNNLNASINFFSEAIKLSPDHIDSLFNLGVINQNTSNYTSAMKFYKKVLKNDNFHFFANYNLATCFNLIGKNEDSIEYFEKCKLLDSDYFQVYLSLSSVFIENGEIEKAKLNLKEAIRVNKKSYEALNNYGVLLHHEKQYNEACDLYKRALSIKPNYLDALVNYGVVLKDLKDIDQSIKTFKKAIEINPNSIECFSNLISLFNLKGDFDNSLKFFVMAKKIDSNNADIFNNFGVTNYHLGKFEKSIEMFEIANRLNQNDFNSLINWGRALDGLGLKNEAINKLKEVVSKDNKNLLARINIIEILNSQKKFIDAINLGQELLEDFPDNSNVIGSLANSYTGLRNFDKAKMLFKKSLNHDKSNYLLWNSLAICLIESENYIEAEQALNKSLEIEKNEKAYYNLGYLYSKLNKLKKAEFFTQKAIEINPHYPDAHVNLGLLLLLKENYSRGLEEYEWRLKSNLNRLVFNYNFDTSYKRWSSELNLDGKVILVHAEQGLGDTIQFCRFLSYLINQNGKVIFKVQDSLVKLLSNIHKNIKVISLSTEVDYFDYQIPLISLLYESNFDIKNYKYTPNYLNYNNKEKFDIWKKYFKKKEFLIGVSWQASKNSIGKSFKLRELSNIANISGVKLVSLQKNEGSEQLKDVGFTIEDLGENFDNGDQAFLDTAAILKNLDLLITCDTSLLHLAGALEVKTFCPLKKYPDWRWGLYGKKTKWYNSVELFRKNEDQSWQEVFKKIENEILKFL